MKEMYIICKNSDTKGIITFYAENKEESYFLFQQKFRRSSYEFYKKGIRMTQAFSYKRTHRDKAIQNVIRRLPAQIAYIEKEYSISILDKTRKKAA